MNQTYSNLQIICLDDGSTDNCPSILDEYALQDERLDVIHQQNTGQGIAKFNALPLIRGKYTMSVDADDWIDLNTVEKCVRIVQEKDADVVVFTPDKRNEDGIKNDAETTRCLKWQFSVSVDDDGIALNKSEVITTNSFWGKLFLTELLLTHFISPGSGMAEDCAALWQVIPAAKRITFLPENLYHYRIVGTSCCNTKGRHHLESLNNCRTIYEKLVKRGQYQEYRDCFLRFLLSAISCNFYMTADEDRYEFLRQFRTLLTKEMKDYYRSTPLWIEHRCWLKKYRILEDNDAVFDKHIKITLAEDDIDEAKEKIRKLKGKHKPLKTILIDTARRISRRIFGTGTVGNFILRIKHLLSRIKQNLIYLFSSERVMYSRFLADKVRPNSVLLIEPNECHGVVVPGYVKYLSDLGYNVDILMTAAEAKIGAAAMLTQPQYRQYTVTWNNMRDIIEKQIKYNDYAVWFFTSSVIYNWERSQRQVWCTVSERFTNLPLDKTVFVSHHKEYNDSESLRSNRLIMLADFLEGAIVIPHYFGNVNITPKNDITKFFVIGTVYPNRRNFSLLFSAVEQLAKQQQQFTVTAIGEGFEELQIPQSIRQYFNFTGKISYPDMYRKLEEADYFLPLFDPDNPKHNRYITEGTSGSFLLIYGFRKPAIVVGKFALPHHLTEDNAVLYETNTELADAMLDAMLLNQEQYQTLQNNLAKTANDIYDRSLNNLRRVINGIADKTFLCSDNTAEYLDTNGNFLMKKYNLRIDHIIFLKKIAKLSPQGKTVLEVGGSNFPRELLFDVLGVKKWVCVDDISHFWSEERDTEGRYQQELSDYRKTATGQNDGNYKAFSLQESTDTFNDCDYLKFDGTAENIPAVFREKFDIAVSDACFEHIDNLDDVLSKILFSLKPGGQFYTMFGPLWSSSVGHHYGFSPAVNFNNSQERGIPPHFHLLWTEEQAREYFSANPLPCGQEELEALMGCAYHNRAYTNGYFYEDYEQAVQKAGFAKYTIVPCVWKNYPVVPENIRELQKRYPGCKRFDADGMEIYGTKIRTP